MACELSVKMLIGHFQQMFVMGEKNHLSLIGQSGKDA